MTKRAKKLAGWEDTSTVAGFSFPEEDSSDEDPSDDPDDPAPKAPIVPTPSKRALAKIKPNDVILYNFQVRFLLLYYSYLYNEYKVALPSYLFLLN